MTNDDALAFILAWVDLGSQVPVLGTERDTQPDAGSEHPGYVNRWRTPDEHRVSGESGA